MKNDFDSPSNPLVQAIRTDCYTELALKKMSIMRRWQELTASLFMDKKDESISPL